MTEDRSAPWPVVKLFASGLLALTCALSLFRFLDSDEVEHVHSTWHVLQGAVPYVDFFQHHHSLLWYVLAPLLALTGESARAVIVFRIVFFLLTLAIAWATYRLARECRASSREAWLSVCLLLSMTSFVYVAIEIRPDVPQALFGVVSAVYFVRMLRLGRGRDALLSGLFAAVAFLFLQKAVLLPALYVVPFALSALRRHVPWRLGLAFAGAFAAACAPFAVYLAATGSFDDYLLANWLLNASIAGRPRQVTDLGPFVLRDFARNAVFWVLSLAAAASAVRRRPGAGYALPAWLGLAPIAVFFAFDRLVDRYVAAAVPFLAVAIALWLSETLGRRQVRGPRLAAALLIICLVPAVSMARAVFRPNSIQLAKIQYVLDRSRPDDRMFDEWRDFNLFRPDMHYAWFMTRPALRFYNRADGRFADYDVCRLLATVKPRFASDRVGHLARCGLEERYRPTPFDRLVELAPE